MPQAGQAPFYPNPAELPPVVLPPEVRQPIRQRRRTSPRPSGLDYLYRQFGGEFDPDNPNEGVVAPERPTMRPPHEWLREQIEEAARATGATGTLGDVFRRWFGTPEAPPPAVPPVTPAPSVEPTSTPAPVTGPYSPALHGDIAAALEAVRATPTTPVAPIAPVAPVDPVAPAAPVAPATAKPAKAPDRAPATKGPRAAPATRDPNEIPERPDFPGIPEWMKRLTPEQRRRIPPATGREIDPRTGRTGRPGTTRETGTNLPPMLRSNPFVSGLFRFLANRTGGKIPPEIMPMIEGLMGGDPSGIFRFLQRNAPPELQPFFNAPATDPATGAPTTAPTTPAATPTDPNTTTVPKDPAAAPGTPAPDTPVPDTPASTTLPTPAETAPGYNLSPPPADLAPGAIPGGSPAARADASPVAPVAATPDGAIAPVAGGAPGAVAAPGATPLSAPGDIPAAPVSPDGGTSVVPGPGLAPSATLAGAAPVPSPLPPSVRAAGGAAPTSTATERLSALPPILRSQQERAQQQSITDASRAGYGLTNLSDVPARVLQGARRAAMLGGPGAVFAFMRQNKHPQSGNWCGEFAAAVMHSQGLPIPPKPEIASNWRLWGTPTDTPKPGDVAIRRGVPTGHTGSHVVMVESVNRDGTMTVIGGNMHRGGQVQLRVKMPMRDYDFRQWPAAAAQR